MDNIFDSLLWRSLRRRTCPLKEDRESIRRSLCKPSAVNVTVYSWFSSLSFEKVEFSKTSYNIGRHITTITETLNTNTGIFITMSPGYAGRSNISDNLKNLFRSIAMTKPGCELISQVTFWFICFEMFTYSCW